MSVQSVFTQAELNCDSQHFSTALNYKFDQMMEHCLYLHVFNWKEDDNYCILGVLAVFL